MVSYDQSAPVFIKGLVERSNVGTSFAPLKSTILKVINMNTLRNTLREQYSQIPNDLITDLTLCSGSLRVLLYLFTKPDDWNVYNADICKQLDISEQTLTKYWKILLNSRWLKREKARDKNGTLKGGYLYQIGDFTVSIKSTESVKSIDYSNNKLINKKENITKEKKVSEYDHFLTQLKRACTYKTKVTNTKVGEELFKGIEDKQKLFNDYILHQKEKGNFANRITAYMEDYKTVHLNSLEEKKKNMSDIDYWSMQ